MLTAIVLHPPRFGARVASVTYWAALAEPGVKAVIPMEEGVAVVAETFADAQRGLVSLKVEWNDERAEQRSSEELLRAHRRPVESGERRSSPDPTAISTKVFSRRLTSLTLSKSCHISRTRQWSPTMPCAG
jgi:hypothetical protein